MNIMHWKLYAFLLVQPFFTFLLKILYGPNLMRDTVLSMSMLITLVIYVGMFLLRRVKLKSAKGYKKTRCNFRSLNFFFFSFMVLIIFYHTYSVGFEIESWMFEYIVILTFIDVTFWRGSVIVTDEHVYYSIYKFNKRNLRVSKEKKSMLYTVEYDTGKSKFIMTNDTYHKFKLALINEV